MTPMFRFTIRDVLWLTVVVALAVGWRMEHSQNRGIRDERDLLRGEHAAIRRLVHDRAESVKMDSEGPIIVTTRRTPNER